MHVRKYDATEMFTRRIHPITVVYARNLPHNGPSVLTRYKSVIAIP